LPESPRTWSIPGRPPTARRGGHLVVAGVVADPLRMESEGREAEVVDKKMLVVRQSQVADLASDNIGAQPPTDPAWCEHSGELILNRSLRVYVC